MIYTFIRIILGLLFVVSGWVKAIDPIGVSYKITDYAAALNCEWIGDLSMPLAILLCGMELFIGLMLIFKLWEKAIAYLTFLFLAFFTVVTLLLVLLPGMSIKECGCFGDAILLTNGQTLAKNIVFILLAFFYARRMYRVSVNSNTRYYYSTAFMSGIKKRQLKKLRFFVYFYIFLFSMGIPLYSALNLPPYTHLPFDIGTDLNHTPITDQTAETKLIYKNIATGEQKKFDIEDTQWQDESKWEYVDTETSGADGSVGVTRFTLYNVNNEDVTQELIENKGYTFMVVVPDVKNLEYPDIVRLNNLYRMRENGQIDFIVATASPYQTSNVVLNSYGWKDIDVYNADVVELKSVLRSNKGLILINNGTISGKWNLRQNIFKNIGYNDIGPLMVWERNTIYIYFIIVGLFVAIMLYLVRLYHTVRR